MTQQRTTIVIAEDHEIVRQGIINLLEIEDDIEIIGQASNGQEAVELANKLQPMVMIIDVGMPVLNGIEAANQIQKNNPNIKIIILSAYYDDSSVMKVFSLDLYGYLTKKCSPLLLLAAIRGISTLKHYYSPEILGRIKNIQITKIDKNGVAKTIDNDLTTREKQVLQLVAEGLANKQMAENLNISIKTVEKHRQHLMNKLCIHDTAGLTRYAIAEGIIENSSNVPYF